MSTSTHRIEAPWSKAPLALTFDDEMTLADIRVFAALDYWAGKRSWCYGSHQQISDRTCLHPDATLDTCPGHDPTVAERSVMRCIAKLVRLGYVGTKRLGPQYQNWTMYYILAREVDAPTEPDDEGYGGLTDWSDSSDLERAARSARASALEHRAKRTPAQSHRAAQRSGTAPPSAVLDKPQTTTTDHTGRPRENTDHRAGASAAASSDRITVHAVDDGFVPTPVTAAGRRQEQIETAVLRACQESNYGGMPIHADDLRSVVCRVRERISRQIEPDEVVAAVNRLRERETTPA